MGSERTVHRLVSVDPERRRGVCLLCGPMAVIPRYESGTWRCGRHFRRLIRLRDSPYIAAKGDVCERCGFVPEHPCQLDVHHRDGNHQNNDPSNLETLCANCHRLERP
jgi:hypothetical protein